VIVINITHCYLVVDGLTRSVSLDHKMYTCRFRRITSIFNYTAKTPGNHSLKQGRRQESMEGCSYFSSFRSLPLHSFFLLSSLLPSPFLSIPSLTFPRSLSLPYLFPSLPPLLSRPFPSPPLRSRPLKPARGFGERCKLPQRGPGQSPGQNRIWCTL